MALSANQLEIVLKARDTASAVISKVSKSMKALGKTAAKIGGGITGAFKKVLGSIFSLKTGFAALAGAAGIGYAIKKTYEHIDAIGKTSRKLGIAAEDLQKYRYAAELSGVSTAEMDKALEQFVRRVGEAKGGTGILSKYLEQMNIQLKGNNGEIKSSSTLLNEFMMALSKVPDPMEKANLAYQAFGRSGVSVVNMLSNGKQGLEEMMKEAELFGFILSENTIIGVEKANDALFKMSSALGGVWKKLSAALAPALEKFATWWAHWLGSFSTAIKPAIEWLTAKMGQVSSSIDGARESGKRWGEAFVEAMKEIKKIFTELYDEVQKYIEQQGGVDKVIQNFKDRAVTAWNTVKSTIDSVLTTINKVVSAINRAIDAYKEFGGGFKGIGAATAALTGATSYDVPEVGSRAGGGPVMGNRPYMVGERGPELFTPSTAGTVSQSGQGTTIINNIYTAATSHGINNALASRQDTAARTNRVGMNVARSMIAPGFTNLSSTRAR